MKRLSFLKAIGVALLAPISTFAKEKSIPALDYLIDHNLTNVMTIGNYYDNIKWKKIDKSKAGIIQREYFEYKNRVFLRYQYNDSKFTSISMTDKYNP